jgi:hypothetical protein
MSMFEDIGFDLLPKNPLPGTTPSTIQPIEAPPVAPRAVSPVVMGTPDPIPEKKGSSTLGWFLFGLLVLGSIGMTIYMAKKDSTNKKTKN